MAMFRFEEAILLQPMHESLKPAAGGVASISEAETVSEWLRLILVLNRR